MVEQELPSVSAIITTLRRPQIVNRAIQSVLSQTYANLELIVVVDGPDPATLNQLSSLSDPRVNVLALPENVGLAEARNEGVRAARGVWVAFLDDDDEWLPDKIRIQIEAALGAGDDINFVASRFEERGLKVARLRPKDFPTPGEHWSEALYCRAVLLLPSTFLVKRSVMLSFPFTKGLRRHEDADWLLRAQAAGILAPHWVGDALAIYHCETTQNRLSTHTEWKNQYQWFLDNPTLLTRKSIPYYIGMLCIPSAQGSPAPVRACSFLIKEAMTKGKLTVHALAYLTAVTLSTRNWRTNLRSRLPILQRRTSWQGTTPDT